VHFLKFDYKEAAIIVRVELNDPNVSIEDIFPDDLIEAQLIEAQLLELENRNGSEIYTYFIKVLRPGPDLTEVGVYVSLPYEIRGGKVKTTFLGNTKQVRDFIKLFDQTGARYRVVSHTDAKF